MVLNDTNKPTIKITSENHYQVENQKVIDNQINRIEVTVKSPQLIHNVENVYNEEVKDNFADGSPQIGIKDSAYRIIGEYKAVGAFSYIDVVPIYITPTINIPKTKENSVITEVFNGKDEYGTANIKYSLYGYVKNGTASGNFTAQIKGGVLENDFTVSEFPPIINTSNYDYYTLDDIVSQKIIYPYTHTEDGLTATATATLTVQDDTNIVEANIDNSDANFYKVSFKLLCGLKITKMGGGFIFQMSGTYSKDGTMSGDYIEYYPSTVSLSFSGSTITLDLQDTPLVFGEGNNILSLNGNELMQTSTIYGNIDIAKYSSSSADSEGYRKIVFNVRDTDFITYQELVVGMGLSYKGEIATITKIVGIQQGNKRIECKCLANGEFYNAMSYIYFNADILGVSIPPSRIIRDWGKGKETATIKCGITDYYDTNGNMVISAETITLSDITYLRSQEETMYYTAKCNKKVAIGTKLKYSYIATYDEELHYDYLTVTDSNGDTITIQTYYDDGFRELVDETDTIKVAMDLPMVFDIGDIDLPYVRGANGQDKPMSKYANGQAKIFEVISSTISYDGAVWQTLDEAETKK